MTRLTVGFYYNRLTAGTTSQRFDVTGSEQTWTVPDGVSSVLISCAGGSGSAAVRTLDNQFYVGGRAALVVARLAVVAGDLYYVYVGSDGQLNPGTAPSFAYNGGGGNTFGYSASEADVFAGGGGGGASDVRFGSNTLADRIIVAGGGGGASIWEVDGVDGMGGDAEQSGQAVGTGTGSGAGNARNGGAGTSGAGGAAGTDDGATVDSSATAGTLGIGGNPAVPLHQLSGEGNAGAPGGGGGGYYGGGGGGIGVASDPVCIGGGGGGSNYVDPAMTDVAISLITMGDDTKYIIFDWT